MKFLLTFAFTQCNIESMNNTHPIKQYREQENLSLAAFGELVGLSEASACRLENGKQTMTIRTAERIMERTGGKIKKVDLLLWPHTS